MSAALCKTRPAFTLIELLVVIGIAALLAGLLLPVLGSARDAANQLNAQSALRQLLLGYTVYQNDSDGHVLYGYPPPTLGGQPITVQADSGHTFSGWAAERYPWRLTPYIDDIWELLHLHASVPPIPLADDSQSEAELKAYDLSLAPAFGINSIYVGGHQGPAFEGFVTAGGVNLPNKGKHVVFRDLEVRRPSSLIVFAETKERQGTSTDPNTGLHFATPPHADGHRWRAPDDRFEIMKPGHITGLPEGRYSAATTTGFFDGHVSVLRPRALDDMRLWANQATTPDYDFKP
ncbi:MAG: prepilin-type N-terminal cleavage/methylation domain-containing protein [Planctomycetota bacterium]